MSWKSCADRHLRSLWPVTVSECNGSTKQIVAFTDAGRSELIDTINHVDLSKVNAIIELFREVRSGARRVFVFGNGGSVATAPDSARYGKGRERSA